MKSILLLTTIASIGFFCTPNHDLEARSHVSVGLGLGATAVCPAYYPPVVAPVVVRQPVVYQGHVPVGAAYNPVVVYPYPYVQEQVVVYPRPQPVRWFNNFSLNFGFR